MSIGPKPTASPIFHPPPAQTGNESSAKHTAETPAGEIVPTAEEQEILKKIDTSSFSSNDINSIKKYVHDFCNYERTHAQSGIKAETLAYATALALREIHNPKSKTKDLTL